MNAAKINQSSRIAAPKEAEAKPDAKEQIRAAINLSSGKLQKNAGEIDTSEQMSHIVDPSVTGKLRHVLEKAMAAGWEHMHDQDSDSYSTYVTPFCVRGEEGEVVGYGVWCGAPGDIGQARLQMFDPKGHTIGTVDEE